MKIRNSCIKYFSSISIVKDPQVSPKAKILAKASIASYFFLIPPLIIGIGLIVSTAAHGISILKHKISKNPFLSKKIAAITGKFFKNVPATPLYINILNRKVYKARGKNITVPDGGAPSKFNRNVNLRHPLQSLRLTYKVGKTPIAMQFKDQTTEQAIAGSQTDHCIAIVFANAEHVGGHSGFHKNPNHDSTAPSSQLFIYDHPPAPAQEESVAIRSTLLESLFQIPHNESDSEWVYDTPIDSTKTAYVSDNHLFGTPAPRSATSGFADSILLAAPKAVTFVTTAANNYRGQGEVDCTKNEAAYKDAQRRIATHLLAAADKAGQLKKENSSQTVEIVLGAFGCGVFAPENAEEYCKMIAGIYQDLLPKFEGFFDVVTFAVPTFGSMPDPEKPNMRNVAVANHVTFKEILTPKTNTDT